MFSKIKNSKELTIIDKFQSVSEFIQYIKNSDRPEVESIIRLRESVQERKSKSQIKALYDYLPAINFNFNFKKDLITTGLAESSTGYLYYELTGLQEFDIDTTYISAFWRTAKNDGYGILIKVNNVTASNFNKAYKLIGEQLQLPYNKYFGYISKKIAVSYDSVAYSNDDALIFETKELENNLQPHPQNNTDSNYYYDYIGGNFGFDNLEEIITELKIEFNSDGVHDFGKNKLEYCKCYVPNTNIKWANRKKSLEGFANCIVSINPNISYSLLESYLLSYNARYFHHPLPNKDVDIILKSSMKLRGKIEPKNNTKRRFIYNEDIFKTTTQKLQYNIKILKNEQKEKTIDYLTNCLLNWDYEKFGKITGKKLILVSGKNKKTVESYYKFARERAGIQLV